MPAKRKTSSENSTATIGFDAKLWPASDKFRQIRRWQWSGATWTTEGCPQGERGGVHQFGVPPKGNANFTLVQHFIHHLAPQTAPRDSAFLQREASPQVVSEAKANMAGFVLANGSMSSNQSGEGDIRRALIEADLVDTALRDSAFPQSEATPQVLSGAKNNMVALPGQLFYSTQIPVCLWFLAKNKAADAKRGFRGHQQTFSSYAEMNFGDVQHTETVPKRFKKSCDVFMCQDCGTHTLN